MSQSCRKHPFFSDYGNSRRRSTQIDRRFSHGARRTMERTTIASEKWDLLPKKLGHKRMVNIDFTDQYYHSPYKKDWCYCSIFTYGEVKTKGHYDLKNNKYTRTIYYRNRWKTSYYTCMIHDEYDGDYKGFIEKMRRK